MVRLHQLCQFTAQRFQLSVIQNSRTDHKTIPLERLQLIIRQSEFVCGGFGREQIGHRLMLQSTIVHNQLHGMKTGRTANRSGTILRAIMAGVRPRINARPIVVIE
jgi:hypothetical protein